jgi:transcriptional regulator of heat shock response
VPEPVLRHCALVAAPWGAAGALGVIGPSRMDYARVIALVDYLSQVVTEKLGA